MNGFNPMISSPLFLFALLLNPRVLLLLILPVRWFALLMRPFGEGQDGR